MATPSMKEVLYRLASLQNDKDEAITELTKYCQADVTIPFFDHASFLGVVSPKKIIQIRKQLKGGHYSCVCMSYAYHGEFNYLSDGGGFVSPRVRAPEDHSTFHRVKAFIFSNHVNAQATPAIECWLMVAKRLSIIRDIRRLIARLLWDDRHLWF